MKVNAIQSINRTNYVNEKKGTGFKGYVNGKYYADSTIELAKKALKNSNWEQELRAKKNTFIKEYRSTDDDEILARIFAGVVSFGTTELAIAALAAMGAAADDTDEKINDIKNCMIDLLKTK